MLAQRNNTAAKSNSALGAALKLPRLMYAKYRGVCKCGLGFLAGEQIEFDPVLREKRCRRCFQTNPTEQYGQVLDFDSYRGLVMRLKQIAELPRPLSANVTNEYWKLMMEISTARESSKSVKQHLESSACCPSGDRSQRFLVALTEDKRCVHCFEVQKRGELVLMDFSKRGAHCIWCECTKL